MTREEIMGSARMGGAVLRYHTWPMITRQTVADHTWHVMRVYVQLFGTPRPEVWEYMLWHDVAELKTGDLPFPVKARNPALRAAIVSIEDQALTDMGIKIPEITPEERNLVKIADFLEMCELGGVECIMGNMLAEPVYMDTLQAALNMSVVADVRPQVEKYIESRFPFNAILKEMRDDE